MESFVDVNGLQRMPGRKMGEKLFEEEDGTVLAKFVVPPDSPFIGEMVTETHLHTHHQSNVLAIRRDEALQQEVEQVELEAGDTLLVQTPVEALSYFQESGELMLVDDSTETPETTEEVREEIPDLDPSTPAAICIMAGVIGLAALGLVPIVIAALGGVVAMVVSGCLSSQDAYRSVSWNIIFLLAGVIPLGLAMQKTGGDEVIGQVIATSGNFLPAVGVLFLLYLITGLLANVITPVATVVLMIPVAVDVAGTIGADEFSFLLGVMFASANSFMTPVGYQTNLMIYVPGGYTFTDFIKVGGPLQLLIALTSTAGIWWFWGV